MLIWRSHFYSFDNKALAKRTDILWQTFEILLVKHHVCRFGHYTSTWSTNIFYFWQAENVFEKFRKHWQVKPACQAMLVMVAKRTSIFDKQNSKCLPDNVSPFGRSLTRLLYSNKIDSLNSEPQVLFSIQLKTCSELSERAFWKIGPTFAKPSQVVNRLKYWKSFVLAVHNSFQIHWFIKHFFIFRIIEKGIVWYKSHRMNRP